MRSLGRQDPLTQGHVFSHSEEGYGSIRITSRRVFEINHTRRQRLNFIAQGDEEAFHEEIRRLEDLIELFQGYVQREDG